MTTTSTDREVHVHISDPWVSVPLRLMEAGCGLSPDARLVLIYMLDLGRRPGWTIYVSQVQRAIGLGPRRWPRIRGELEARGYFVSDKGHASNGDWKWTYHVFDSPVRVPPSGIPAKCRDAKCSDANRKDRRSSTSPSSTSSRSAAEEAPAQAQPAAAVISQRRRQTHGATGIVYWLVDEVPEIERLVDVYGVDAVRDAVDGVLAQGQEPFQSAIAKRLQAARRAEVAAARRQGATAAEREQVEQRARIRAAVQARSETPEPARRQDTRSMEEIIAGWRVQSQYLLSESTEKESRSC